MMIFLQAIKSCKQSLDFIFAILPTIEKLIILSYDLLINRMLLWLSFFNCALTTTGECYYLLHFYFSWRIFWHLLRYFIIALKYVLLSFFWWLYSTHFIMTMILNAHGQCDCCLRISINLFLLWQLHNARLSRKRNQRWNVHRINLIGTSKSTFNPSKTRLIRD
jgi:hypothetical protein